MDQTMRADQGLNPLTFRDRAIPTATRLGSGQRPLSKRIVGMLITCAANRSTSPCARSAAGSYRFAVVRGSHGSMAA